MQLSKHFPFTPSDKSRAHLCDQLLWTNCPQMDQSEQIVIFIVIIIIISGKKTRNTVFIVFESFTLFNT